MPIFNKLLKNWHVKKTACNSSNKKLSSHCAFRRCLSYTSGVSSNKHARPDLLSRIRILAFCPGKFIDENNFSGAQIRNIVKNEDTIITRYASGANRKYLLT